LEDFFSLNNYLESIDKGFSTSLVNDFNKIEAENILTRMAIELKEYALEIIEGREWLSNYYPR